MRKGLGFLIQLLGFSGENKQGVREGKRRHWREGRYDMEAAIAGGGNRRHEREGEEQQEREGREELLLRGV